MALFSEREIRALAIFLPLAGLLFLGPTLPRPQADPGAARLVPRPTEQRPPTPPPAPPPRRWRAI